MSLDDLIANEELSVGLDPEHAVVRLRAVASFDEPLELGAEAARELALRLLELADEID